jgi:hypothetical protein
MSSTAATSPAPGPAAGNRAPAPPRVGMFPPIGLPGQAVAGAAAVKKLLAQA